MPPSGRLCVVPRPGLKPLLLECSRLYSPQTGNSHGAWAGRGKTGAVSLPWVGGMWPAPLLS